jgi:hypothetical protein
VGDAESDERILGLGGAEAQAAAPAAKGAAASKAAPRRTEGTDIERMARRVVHVRGDGGVGSSSHDDRLMFDAMITAWPLFLVQGMLLVLLGYMVRGCQEKRRRKAQAARKAQCLAATPYSPTRRLSAEQDYTWGGTRYAQP